MLVWLSFSIAAPQSTDMPSCTICLCFPRWQALSRYRYAPQSNLLGMHRAINNVLMTL